MAGLGSDTSHCRATECAVLYCVMLCLGGSSSGNFRIMEKGLAPAFLLPQAAKKKTKPEISGTLAAALPRCFILSHWPLQAPASCAGAWSQP